MFVNYRDESVADVLVTTANGDLAVWRQPLPERSAIVMGYNLAGPEWLDGHQVSWRERGRQYIAHPCRECGVMLHSEDYRNCPQVCLCQGAKLPEGLTLPAESVKSGRGRRIHRALHRAFHLYFS